MVEVAEVTTILPLKRFLSNSPFNTQCCCYPNNRANQCNRGNQRHLNHHATTTLLLL